MTHPHDDELLQYALELLSETESETIARHLSECSECRDRLRKIQSGLSLLKGIAPSAPTVPLPSAPPFPKQVMYTILKTAAILFIGFFAGFGTSRSFCPRPVNVVSSYLIPVTPTDTLSRYVVCEAIDLNAEVK